MAAVSYFRQYLSSQACQMILTGGLLCGVVLTISPKELTLLLHIPVPGRENE